MGAWDKARSNPMDPCIYGPMDLSRSRPYPRRVERNLADAIEARIALDDGVGERHRTERREAERGGDEAKGLAEMSRVEQHRAIGARRVVLPSLALDDGGHQKEGGGARIPRLRWQVSRRREPHGGGSDSRERVPRGVVVIE